MSVKSQFSRYTLVLIIGVAAFLILSLAWPRLRASVRYLPVDTALSRWRAALFQAEKRHAAKIFSAVKLKPETC